MQNHLTIAVLLIEISRMEERFSAIEKFWKKQHESHNLPKDFLLLSPLERLQELSKLSYNEMGYFEGLLEMFSFCVEDYFKTKYEISNQIKALCGVDIYVINRIDFLKNVKSLMDEIIGSDE